MTSVSVSELKTCPSALRPLPDDAARVLVPDVAADAAHGQCPFCLAAAERARLRAVQPSFITCWLRSTARAPGGTSLVTTEPAATNASSPMVIGATTLLLLPTNARSPTFVSCLLVPS